MQELTDDQLDGLFRKSAEEFTPPFDPLAWQDMQRRLDTHEKTRPAPVPLWEHLVRWGLPALLLMLLTGGGWYAYDKNQHRATTITPGTNRPVQPVTQPTRQARQSAVLPAINKRLLLAGDKLPNKLVTTDRNKPAPAVYGNAASRVPEAVNVGTEQRDQPRNRRRALAESELVAKRTETPVVTDNQLKNAIVPASRNLSEQQTAVNQPTIANQQAAVNELLADLRPDNVPAEYPRDDAQATPSTSFDRLATRPARWPANLPFVGREVVTPAQAITEPTQPVRQPATVERGFSVRFAVSPDLSAVGLRNFARPGTNVGLLAEYRLAPRWSVQAGVLRSTKVYRASSSAYELPHQYSYWKVKPESISGQCNMLDIPINLRYDVARMVDADGQVRGRWFVSGGATSYIMSREEYTYNYANPNDPGIRNTNKLVDSISRYGFSQLNLSVGYERTINRRLSWQVEPFLKMPLKGIGYYKVNLLSTGVFFSLRYKFNP